MSRYLSMLKPDIKEFVLNNRYKTLIEMQEHARMREIELETHTREKSRALAPSQSTTKKFKHTGSRFGSLKGHTCNKCRKFHDDP